MTTHYLWDVYTKCLAGGMTDAQARAKLREAFPADAGKIDAVIAARGDMRNDPDPHGFNSEVRAKALRGRRTVELLFEDIMNAGRQPQS